MYVNTYCIYKVAVSADKKVHIPEEAAKCIPKDNQSIGAISKSGIKLM